MTNYYKGYVTFKEIMSDEQIDFWEKTFKKTVGDDSTVDAYYDQVDISFAKSTDWWSFVYAITADSIKEAKVSVSGDDVGRWTWKNGWSFEEPIYLSEMTEESLLEEYRKRKQPPTRQLWTRIGMSVEIPETEYTDLMEKIQNAQKALAHMKSNPVNNNLLENASKIYPQVSITEEELKAMRKKIQEARKELTKLFGTKGKINGDCYLPGDEYGLPDDFEF